MVFVNSWLETVCAWWPLRGYFIFWQLLSWKWVSICIVVDSFLTARLELWAACELLVSTRCCSLGDVRLICLPRCLLIAGQYFRRYCKQIESRSLLEIVRGFFEFLCSVEESWCSFCDGGFCDSCSNILWPDQICFYLNWPKLFDCFSFGKSRIGYYPF